MVILKYSSIWTIKITFYVLQSQHFSWTKSSYIGKYVFKSLLLTLPSVLLFLISGILIVQDNLLLVSLQHQVLLLEFMHLLLQFIYMLVHYLDFSILRLNFMFEFVLFFVLEVDKFLAFLNSVHNSGWFIYWEVELIVDPLHFILDLLLFF